MKPNRSTRRHHRDRRALATAVGMVAGLLLLTSAYLWSIGAGVPRDVIGGSFALVQGDGRPVTDRSFRGKFLMIYFGYTSCRDVCPTTLASVAAALDSLGGRAREVQPLFITVDPGRDTPEVVQRYASSFTPQMIGLTGTPAELRQVARAYRVSSVIHHSGDTYAVDHSSVIFLVGRDGRYIAPMRADASGPEMAALLARYLS